LLNISKNKKIKKINVEKKTFYNFNILNAQLKERVISLTSAMRLCFSIFHLKILSHIVQNEFNVVKYLETNGTHII
jgi:hypothetical protein